MSMRASTKTYSLKNVALNTFAHLNWLNIKTKKNIDEIQIKSN